jgi:hypothetical protein
MGSVAPDKPTVRVSKRKTFAISLTDDGTSAAPVERTKSFS